MKSIKSVCFYLLLLFVSLGFVTKSLADNTINKNNSEVILTDVCSPLDHNFVMLSKKKTTIKNPGMKVEMILEFFMILNGIQKIK